MGYAKRRAVSFVGLDLSTGKIHMPPGAAQVDVNGDRRRRGAWRVRAGYARLLSGNVHVQEDNRVEDDFAAMSPADELQDEANWTGAGFDGDDGVKANASGQIQMQSPSGGYGVVLYSGAAFTDDHFAEAAIDQTSPGIGEIGPIVRASASGGYVFVLYPDSGLSFLYRFNGTGLTLLASASVATPGGSIARLEARNSTLRCYVNGALVITTTDTTFTTGDPGVFAAILNGFGTLDDFAAGDLVNVTEAVVVPSIPSRITAFERDDDVVKVLVAHGAQVTVFDAGEPEWS